MKKIFGAAVAATLLATSTYAASVNISSRYGTNLLTYAQTDNDAEVDDGLFFADDYFNNKVGAQYTSRGCYDFMTFKADGARAGVEARFKVMSKELGMRLYNGYITFGNLKLIAGRFDAYPVVDIITDATAGYHFNSYAAQYQPGFDPQVMSLFLREEGFLRHENSRIASTAKANVNTQVSLDLESNNWYFYDANNAGACIDYDTTYFGNRGGYGLEYALGDEWLFRFVQTFGSAWSEQASYVNNYFGEKTFTNFNLQANYTMQDVFKAALTFKMSDIVSGIYTDGDALLQSAGSDLQAMLAVSSDYFYNLKLYADYMFAATFVGMEDEDGNSDMLGFHAIDLRAIYELADNFRIGFNGNLSMIAQSDYIKEYAKANDTDIDDFIGFNAGLSASYDLSDLITLDFDTGFRCVNLNNRNSKGDKDMMQVSAIGAEAGVCFNIAKGTALNLGLNCLFQNFSSEDEGKNIWLNNNKNSTAAATVYPGTVVVTVPMYMKVSL